MPRGALPSEPSTFLHPPPNSSMPPMHSACCRQREEQEAADREAARYKSDRITLQSMFNTTITAPGEQPTGVTLVDGYNLLFSVKNRKKQEQTGGFLLLAGCSLQHTALTVVLHANPPQLCTQNHAAMQQRAASSARAACSVGQPLHTHRLSAAPVCCAVAFPAIAADAAAQQAAGGVAVGSRDKTGRWSLRGGS